MWIKFFNLFAKITGWLLQWFCFRTKVYYEDKSVQGRHIKGRAIIVSNHTSVYDYAVMMFVFITRTLRYQMAEILFEKKGLRTLLRWLGGIYVNRNNHDLSFVRKSVDILDAGGVVGVFPEGRLPRKGEESPLPFASSVTYIALQSGAPIIPVYTNGSYFCKKRARVIIGKPIAADELADSSLTEKENLQQITEKIRERIKELGKELDEKTKKS
ncbi:MAG: lysophospholipid acyltransferase family protein [Bacillota bacterium]|nr:lysophospholipid acyltransferase family protein [Bacillota bacterium]